MTFLAATCSAVISQGVPDKLPPGIDRSKVILHLDKFQFSSSGALIDGLRQPHDQEIDYSELVYDNLAAELFVESIYGCEEVLRECAYPYRLPSWTASISGVVENSSLDQSPLEISKESAGNVLVALGFTVSDTPASDKININLILGNLDDLLNAAVDRKDRRTAINFNEIKKDTEFGREQRDKNGLCFVNTSQRGKGNIDIYFDPRDKKECLGRSILAAVGLNETAAPAPTLTGVYNKYVMPTRLDVLYLHLLNSKDFPSNNVAVDVLQFYRNYVRDHPHALD